MYMFISCNTKGVEYRFANVRSSARKATSFKEYVQFKKIQQQHCCFVLVECISMNVIILGIYLFGILVNYA